jgi:hypothetical protein
MKLATIIIALASVATTASR